MRGIQLKHVAEFQYSAIHVTTLEELQTALVMLIGPLLRRLAGGQSEDNSQ